MLICSLNCSHAELLLEKHERARQAVEDDIGGALASAVAAALGDPSFVSVSC